MIGQLILPAVYAGVAVWLSSAIIWMFLRWHDKDIQPLPDEAGFIASIESQGIPAGHYMWPNCATREEHGSDAFMEKWSRGPWGTINVLGGRPNFARNLIGTLIINIVVAFGIAAALGLALGGVQCEADALFTCSMCQVFVPVLILGAVVYCLGGLGNDLFLGKQPRFICTSVLDGLIYAAVQAGVLWWAWPVA